MTIDIAPLLIGLLLLAGLALTGIFTVQQQTVAIIERFGKFHRVAEPGLRVKIPIVDRIAWRMDLRQQQLSIELDTKTKDDVFVDIDVALQYTVADPKRAFYQLHNASEQITSYVENVVRARVPSTVLDRLFEEQDELSAAIKAALDAHMADFGYVLHHALVTAIEPDEKVVNAMNEIQAQERLRVAATAKAEADKVIRIKAAEAESEAKRLQGVGIANQRAAIARGFRESLEEMTEAFGGDESGADAHEISHYVLLTQYFDTLAAMGKDGARVIFMPQGPSALGDLQAQIRAAVTSAQEAGSAS